MTFVTITFNSGDESVTINDILLSKIEENDSKTRDSFFTSDGPAKRATWREAGKRGGEWPEGVPREAVLASKRSDHFKRNPCNGREKAVY